MAGSHLIKDLPPALQAPVPVQDPLQEVDLVRCTPYAVSPQVPTFQIELSICPRYDVPMHKLSFETSLNTFSVAQNPKGQTLTFPFLTFVPEGESTAGLKLIVDNSPSPNSNLGPHTRVSWSVDTTAIAPETAAVALALSSDNLFNLRMIAFKLFQTRIDTRGQVERKAVLAQSAVMDNVLKERCLNNQAGTLVLAILSRSSAWWHIHMPLAYAYQPRARQFSMSSCRPRTWGQESLITDTLARVQQRGGYGYPDLRNITVTVEQVRGLPVSRFLEKVACGAIGTYVRPSLRVIDTLTGRTRSFPHPREYPTKRADRRTGSMAWDAVERVPLGLSLYHVHAAITDIIRITLYTGSRSECDSSAHADDQVAEQPGGTDGTYQFRDVLIAELWQLLRPGAKDSECSVELRMQAGPSSKVHDANTYFRINSSPMYTLVWKQRVVERRVAFSGSLPGSISSGQHKTSLHVSHPYDTWRVILTGRDADTQDSRWSAHRFNNCRAWLGQTHLGGAIEVV